MVSSGHRFLALLLPDKRRSKPAAKTSENHWINDAYDVDTAEFGQVTSLPLQYLDRGGSGTIGRAKVVQLQDIAVAVTAVLAYLGRDDTSFFLCVLLCSRLWDVCERKQRLDISIGAQNLSVLINQKLEAVLKLSKRVGSQLRVDALADLL